MLAQTIARSRVILGQSGFRLTDQESGTARVQIGFATIGPDPGPHLVTYPDLLRNIAVLEQAAAGRGHRGGGPLTDRVDVRVHVTPVNDAPVGVSDTYSTGDSRTLTITAPGVLANDTDVDSANLVAGLISRPRHGSAVPIGITLGPA